MNEELKQVNQQLGQANAKNAELADVNKQQLEQAEATSAMYERNKQQLAQAQETLAEAQQQLEDGRALWKGQARSASVQIVPAAWDAARDSQARVEEEWEREGGGNTGPGPPSIEQGSVVGACR
jgi:septal ring factor EnvC (AmiA/AmiB activator)